MKKKTLFLGTVATAVVASSVVPVGVNAADLNFEDVAKTNSHYDAIMDLANRGIINGYGDGTFGVGNSVTRGQAAKILAGVLGLALGDGKNTGFSDVPATNGFAREILALKELGVINGYADGTYKPNDPITRNQMAIILTRALQLEAPQDIKLPFKDVGKTNKNEISALYHYGITLGTTPTTFGGNDYVTRGQFASFVVRAEKAVGNGQTLVVESVTNETLKAQGKTYALNSAVKALLNEGNATALKDAKIKVKLEKDKIVAITGLELNHAGTAATPVIFDGGKATIAGDVKINADSIELKNVKIDGNLILKSKASTSFVSNEVDVQGELIVDEVTQSPTAALTPVATTAVPFSLDLNGGSFNSLRFYRPGITLNSDNPLPLLYLEDSANDVTLNANIGKLLLPLTLPPMMIIGGVGTINQLEIGEAPTAPILGTQAPILDLQMRGSISNFIVMNPLLRVQAGPEVIVNTFIAPTTVNPTTLFTNPNDMLSKIGKFQLPDGTSVVAPTIPPSTSGGGSGSIPSPTPTAPKIEPEVATNAIKQALKAFETEIIQIENSIYDYNSQKYADSENQAYEKFITVFELNAPSAGYDLTDFKKYPFNGKKMAINSWAFYTSQSKADFDALTLTIKSGIELLYKVLEAETPTTLIAENDTESNGAIDILTSYNTPNEYEFLSFYGSFIGLDLKEYYKFSALSNDVLTTLLSLEKDTNNSRFNRNTEAIQTAINTALTNEKNIIMTTLLENLNKLLPTETSNLERMFNDNKDYFGIDYSKFYKYSTTIKNNVLEEILKKIPYQTIESVRQEFESALETELQAASAPLLQSINAASEANFESVRTTLENNALTLNLDLFYYYNILDTVNRQNVAKAIIANKGDGYSSGDALLEAFNSALKNEMDLVLQNAQTLGFGTAGTKVANLLYRLNGTVVFKLDLKANQYYTFTTRNFGIDYNITPFITLYRPKDSSLEYVEHFYAYNDSFSTEVSEDGIYYFGYKSSEPDKLGSYSLRMDKSEKLDGNLLDLGLEGWDWFDLSGDLIQIGNKSIVKVNPVYNGVTFTGLSPGTTTVKLINMAKWDGTPQEATVTVTVDENLQVTFGEITNTKYTVINNSSDVLGLEAVTVESSNPTVATAEITNNWNIFVKTVAAGTTTITAIDEDGRQATIDVTVDENLVVTYKITKYITKVTSVEIQAANIPSFMGNLDNLIFTFSDAIVNPGVNISTILNTESSKISLTAKSTLTNEGKTLILEINDNDLAAAKSITLTGIKDTNNNPVLIENVSIPFPTIVENEPTPLPDK